MFKTTQWRPNTLTPESSLLLFVAACDPAALLGLVAGGGALVAAPGAADDALCSPGVLFPADILSASLSLSSNCG